MAYFLDQFVNGLSLGCVYALIALGFAMVYGILRFLNFAHSEVFTTGAFLGYFVLQGMGEFAASRSSLALAAALVVAGLGAGLLALLIERVAYRPLRGRPKVEALLTAIGVSVVLQNVGIHLFSARTRGYPEIHLAVAPRPFAIMVLAASYAVLHILVFRTDIGLRMRAVAEDPETAQLMGIDPNRSVMTAFFVGGLFAGVAGVTWGLVYGTVNPQMGFYPGLKAFIIAVIGGIGSLRGTFLIGIGLGIVEALAGGYLPSALSGFRDTFLFAALIGVLVWKPTGFFGTTEPARV